ncbi:hypothetical protein BC828DRAFT_388927 [Blastocladiella britannica]|nr:hypothetical protein BC828DRAFT_388927 [Blastocladiella britannica]
MNCGMEDLALAAEQQQADEMVALAAIFPDTFEAQYSHGLRRAGTLSIAPELSGDLTLSTEHLLPPTPPTYTSSSSRKKKRVATGPASTTATARISTLPALQLRFELPPNYPLDQAAVPLFTVECPWLDATESTAVCDSATRAASSAVDDQSVALFEAHAAASATLDGITRALPSPWPVPALVFDVLVRHDCEQAQSALTGRIYACMICLETKSGKDGVAVPGCAHMFCRHCLTQFFTVLIEEGMPRQVACPHPDCGKKPSSGHAPHTTAVAEAEEPQTNSEIDIDAAHAALRAHPIQPDFLADLVGADRAATWADQYLNRQYSADPEMVWCPRPTCGGPARGHAASHPYAKLATCLGCRYAFCVHCARAWHGPAQACAIRDAQGVVAQVLAVRAIVDDPARRDREMRALYVKYSRSVLDRLVRDHDADEAARRWVAENAQACPGCGLAVVRSEGCAHMVCPHCATHFCYTCGVNLRMYKSPYDHYNLASSSCNGRLFDGAGIDEARADELAIMAMFDEE